MRTIWAVYRADLRRARRSVISLVVILGLTAIPALFTWFNVAASWDPFSNTKNLTIAIANTDQGYKSDLVPLTVNIGDQVVAALRANEDFDWAIESEEGAVEKTRSGQYYAAVVIPVDFSKDMMTFFSSPDARSAPLTYYINEKKNGLAPKIAGQGAEHLSAQVNQVFAQTLAEIALDTASSIAGAMEDPSNTRALGALDTRIQTVASRLAAAANSAEAYAALVDASLTLLDSTSALVSNASGAGAAAQSGASGLASGGTGLAGAVQTATASVVGALSASQSSLSALSESIEGVYSQADGASASAVASLRSQAGVFEGQAAQYASIKSTLAGLTGSPVPSEQLDRLQSAVDRLNGLAEGLRSAATALEGKNTSVQTNHTTVAQLIADAQSAVSTVRGDYDNTLKPQLDSLASSLEAGAGSLENVRAALASAASGVNDGTGGARSGLTRLRDAFKGAAESLREAEGKLTSMHDSLAEALTSGDIARVRAIIGSDPKALAAALAAPVGIETNRVFPVDNFGSQMAPLYSVLALWVGSVLMVIAMRSDVTDDNAADGLNEDDPLRRYFASHRVPLASGFIGRYLVFGTIALLQATLVFGGDIVFLKVQHTHPWLFMCVGWLTAVVFSFMLYTLVATFGNAGKAIGVLLLVLQISGAGGAFPLVLLPPFFSAVSPFLPATHAITALRAAIAGYSGAEYADAMWMLAAFIPVCAFGGLALRPLLVSKNRALVGELESTKLI